MKGLAVPEAIASSVQRLLSRPNIHDMAKCCNCIAAETAIGCNCTLNSPLTDYSRATKLYKTDSKTRKAMQNNNGHYWLKLFLPSLLLEPFADSCNNQTKTAYAAACSAEYTLSPPFSAALHPPLRSHPLTVRVPQPEPVPDLQQCTAHALQQLRVAKGSHLHRQHMEEQPTFKVTWMLASGHAVYVLTSPSSYRHLQCHVSCSSRHCRNGPDITALHH